nr:hypothetical protein Iba_chr01aCG17040 [Ipomoea batatas]
MVDGDVCRPAPQPPSPMNDAINGDSQLSATKDLAAASLEVQQRRRSPLMTTKTKLCFSVRSMRLWTSIASLHERHQKGKLRQQLFTRRRRPSKLAAAVQGNG